MHSLHVHLESASLAIFPPALLTSPSLASINVILSKVADDILPDLVHLATT